MKNKNLKECPSGNQVQKISRWANLKNINLLSFMQFLNRRVFFWIFTKKVRAVLTVEAAVVVPIFMLALCTMMGALDCYRIQSIIKSSIHQSAMELGMYAYGTESEKDGIHIINSAFCVSYAQARLPAMEDNVTVSMDGSHYKNDTITLIATIKYKFPISLFPVSDLKLVNISEVNSWAGASHKEDEVSSVTYKMVYVTENRSVYHTSVDCSHIDIKVYEAKKKAIKTNYKACKNCCDKQSIENDQVVYYTRTGDSYHITSNCSSLKRMVRVVEISQVRGLPICERCEKRGNS